MKIVFDQSHDDFTKNEITVIVSMTHKEWLNNEYNQWIEALNSCTVHNFKEHTMTERMLGRISPRAGFYAHIESGVDWSMIAKIDKIGSEAASDMSGICFRYVYYAQQILSRNPSSICEIGGGVGQFYAILRALGYKGQYLIMDLKDVQLFQNEYLKEVSRQTGLNTDQILDLPAEMIISFYALGEFTDDMKEYYTMWINVSRNGYIAWNPHSGASDDLSIFDAHDIKVTPGIEEGIKIIEW